MKSSLKKVNNEFTIIEKDEEIRFIINNNSEEKISIYDEELLENIIESNFNKKYRKLLYIIMELVENEDSTESDVELALVKIENLKNVLLNKYYKYIGKDLLNKYLKMIMLLEEKISMPKRGRGR